MSPTQSIELHIMRHTNTQSLQETTRVALLERNCFCLRHPNTSVVSCRMFTTNRLHFIVTHATEQLNSHPKHVLLHSYFSALETLRLSERENHSWSSVETVKRNFLSPPTVIILKLFSLPVELRSISENLPKVWKLMLRPESTEEAILTTLQRAPGSSPAPKQAAFLLNVAPQVPFFQLLVVYIFGLWIQVRTGWSSLPTFWLRQGRPVCTKRR